MSDSFLTYSRPSFWATLKDMLSLSGESLPLFTNLAIPVKQNQNISRRGNKRNSMR